MASDLLLHKVTGMTYIYTWSYESLVSKHFVIFLNLSCLIACLLCCLLCFLLALWLGICVEVNVDRITILAPPYSFSLPTILCLTQVTVI